MNALLSQLIELDHALFAKINLDWTNSVFDWLMPILSDLNREPLALLIILPLIAFWLWKKRLPALKWLLVTLVCVGLSDLVSYRLIKASVGRDRPPDAGIVVQVRTPFHSGFSFPSNHAANTFAAATALSGALPPLAPAFYLFAFLVAYSRVYVGVHFPLDVIGGALIGIAISVTARFLLSAWLNRPFKGGFNRGGSFRERN